MFDDDLWKSYVYRTAFSNVKYQDLCAKINLLKIKDLQKLKTISNYLCNNIIIVQTISFGHRPKQNVSFMQCGLYLIPLGIDSICFNHPSLNFMNSVNYIN